MYTIYILTQTHILWHLLGYIQWLIIMVCATITTAIIIITINEPIGGIQLELVYSRHSFAHIYCKHIQTSASISVFISLGTGVERE